MAIRTLVIEIVRLRALARKTGRRDLNRSIHNWPPLHIDSVGKWLVAGRAPGVRMTRENLRVTL